MDTNANALTVMSTKPLKTAIFYDFYLCVQLLAFILLCVSVGRLAFAVDRLLKRPLLTPRIVKLLESTAALTVVKS